MSLTKHEAASRHALHYQEILRVADGYFGRDSENARKALVQLERDWDQIRQGQLWAASYADRDSIAAMLCVVYADASRVLKQYLTPDEHIRWVKGAEAGAQSPVGRCYVLKPEGDRFVSLGSAYSDLGEHEGAIEFYQQGLEFARKTGNKVGESNILNSLGSACRNLTQYGEAIDYQEKALTIARQIGYMRGVGNALNSLGNVYLDLSQHEQAIDNYQRALAIGRTFRDRQGERNALCNLGSVYLELGHYGGAIEYYNRALSIKRETAHKSTSGSILNNLGCAYSELEKYEEAIDYFQQALAVFEQLDMKRAVERVDYSISAARAAQRFPDQKSVISDDKKPPGKTRPFRIDAIHIELEWPELDLATKYAMKFAEDSDSKQNEAYIHAGLTNGISTLDNDGTALWFKSMAFYEAGDLASAIACAEAALEVLEQMEYPDVPLVRNLLAKWRKQARKKWWQFWK